MMATEANVSSGALSGLRVLDLTGRMGGYCGVLLANLGAEVILIEPPGGDPMRREGPFKNNHSDREQSLSFAAYHTNKRGVVLDLENDKGRASFRELVRHADALIEDQPAGHLDRLGLGYQALQSLNPALVMTSITGFGQSGPYRDFKAPNIVAFAMGGLMNLCGQPGRAPLMGPCDVAYHLGSVHAAFGTLMALFNRRATDRGDHVDVSLQDVLVADPFLRIITRYSVTGEVPERTGHSQSTTVAETYECKDGYARIFVNQADHWNRFVEWLGRPPELLDPKYENAQNRFPLRETIDRLVEARTLNYEAKKFFDEFQSLRLAAAPINSPSAFLADEQTQHRNFVTTVEHSGLGRHDFPGDPYRLSESPWRVERGAPLLGENQEQIHQELARPSAWLSESIRSDTSLPRGMAFEGVRVISFPTGIVGPALAGLFAEHGAEVISIEAGRVAPSPQHGQKFQTALDFESNRDRKRIVIDMKHPDGVALAKKLVAKSDVVVENFSARVMASWGLDYPRMKEIRPDIIMASLQAFGQTGPRRGYVSFGPILMAYSGMAYLWRDPEVERPGAGCQTAFPDYVAPSYAAVAILAALHYRARTGKGQHIDISQAETAASMIGPAYLEYLITGREPQPQGNFSALAAPHGCYRCKGDDRWCVIAVQTQEEWIRFCEVAGHREWLTDHRFSEPSARIKYRQELDYWIEKWTAKYTPHQVMVMLQREGIAAAVVQTAEDLYRDPHLRERGFAREVHHPQVGWVTRAGPSVRLTEHGFTPRGFTRTAGEDNEAVLRNLLGMSSAEISDLVDRKVLR
ncbi:MAG TPA: CoA transferase [Candidatus Binatia bacterium]|jgi:crotonobetainyl-CoA:carnitine CoA-transferase CaiB-like acyl-CoA transferase